MLGRSDGILNPSGVRFGSSEIYDCLEGLDAVEDSLVVGQVGQSAPFAYAILCPHFSDHQGRRARCAFCTTKATGATG